MKNTNKLTVGIMGDESKKICYMKRIRRTWRKSDRDKKINEKRKTKNEEQILRDKKAE